MTAFEELVRRHATIAVRAARSFGGMDEVDEIVQDAFVKAYRALARFDLERPFRPWLIAFVANELSHRRRSRQRRARLSESAIAGGRVAESSAEDRMMQAMDHVDLRSKLGRLDRKDRDVIVYRYLLESLGGGDRRGAALPHRHGEVAIGTGVGEVARHVETGGFG